MARQKRRTESVSILANSAASRSRYFAGPSNSRRTCASTVVGFSSEDPACSVLWVTCASLATFILVRQQLSQLTQLAQYYPHRRALSHAKRLNWPFPVGDAVWAGIRRRATLADTKPESATTQAHIATGSQHIQVNCRQVARTRHRQSPGACFQPHCPTHPRLKPGTTPELRRATSVES